MDASVNQDKKQEGAETQIPIKMTFLEALEELMKSPDRVIILVRKEAP